MTCDDVRASHAWPAEPSGSGPPPPGAPWQICRCSARHDVSECGTTQCNVIVRSSMPCNAHNAKQHRDVVCFLAHIVNWMFGWLTGISSSQGPSELGSMCLGSSGYPQDAIGVQADGSNWSPGSASTLSLSLLLALRRARGENASLRGVFQGLRGAPLKKFEDLCT